MTQAYPLTWPENWPRTRAPGKSQFKTSISAALNNVQDSLRRFGSDSGKKIEAVVISSNVTLGDQRPADCGVAVYFTWDGISTCIAVDRYAKVEENLQAIHHCIEAERTKLRHGGLNIVKAAFRGYAALPPPSAGTSRPWWDVLECHDLAARTPMDKLEESYKRLAKKHHPDAVGGSAEKMAELNAAIAQARKEKA